jgi:hypothetical protein
VIGFRNRFRYIKDNIVVEKIACET